MSEKPIKVVHVMPQIAIGGAELQLYSLINNSDPNIVTHEVVYYENSDPDCLRLFGNAGIKLTRIYRKRMRPIKFLYDLSRAIRKCRADIVHCWLFSGSVWGRWSAILAGAKKILVAYRNCELPYSGFLWLLERIPFNSVRYLGNSKAVADFVSKRLGVKRNRFNVVYNGIDVTRFDVTGDKEDFKKELSIPFDNKVVTMLGRLVPQKNYGMFLEIAAECKKAKLPLCFVIAGKGFLKEELLALAETLDVADIVHFAGVRQDIPFVLRSSNFYCFTSRFEGFPNVILEAMAASLPIVTTDFAGIREVIEAGENGIIVPIDDTASACDCLRKFCDNPEAAIALGGTARKNVEDRFAMNVMVDETVKVYKRMLLE